jgi:hypothetical protein
MYWYKIILTADDLDEMRSIDLIREIGQRAAREGYPRDFALFSVANGRNDGAVYYLPPTAMEICPTVLSDFNAIPDDVPAKTSLTVAVGEDSALDHWFRTPTMLASTDYELNSRPRLALPRLVLN